MLADKDYKEFATLASRLAESVLMDWDKEEQVRLAKEVAIKCHKIFNEKEIREFVELVKRMRDAQKEWEADLDVYDEHWGKSWEKEKLEKEVDGLLEQMEA